jgi:hypothetical protein
MSADTADANETAGTAIAFDKVSAEVRGGMRDEISSR